MQIGAVILVFVAAYFCIVLWHLGSLLDPGTS
jgi:hypothetical protein